MSKQNKYMNYEIYVRCEPSLGWRFFIRETPNARYIGYRPTRAWAFRAAKRQCRLNARRTAREEKNNGTQP